MRHHRHRPGELNSCVERLRTKDCRLWDNKMREKCWDRGTFALHCRGLELRRESGVLSRQVWREKVFFRRSPLMVGFGVFLWLISFTRNSSIISKGVVKNARLKNLNWIYSKSLFFHERRWNCNWVCGWYPAHEWSCWPSGRCYWFFICFLIRCSSAGSSQCY